MKNQLIQKGNNLFALSPTFDYKTGEYTGDAQSGVVFTECMDSKEDIVVLQGGTDSGKTYGAIQYLSYLAVKEEAPDIDPIITILGSTVPNLKKGAYRHFKNIVNSSKVLPGLISNWKDTERIVEFKTGWIIEFVSAITEQEAKQGKRQYLFANEANGIDWPIFWQMAKRTRRQTFIDYNPTAKFWAHEKLIGRTKFENDLSATVKLIITDHRHNPFLSLQDHFRTENIPDKELFKVYARGLTGKITGLIWSHYKECDEIPEFIDTCYGLDVGFNHPTALIETGEWFEEKALYWDEKIYESKLTTGDLIDKMKLEGISKTKAMYVDSARPDVIEELQKAGYNALPAEKDVLEGIRYVKYRQLFITKRSKNLKKELDGYKWKEDKKTGESIDEPVKFKDDACDAGRYGSYSNRDSEGGNISISRSDSSFLDSNSHDDQVNDFLNSI
ncbi:terminase large subunit [Elizabethkingia anophelis]|uniref:terminase large subunit n=1 Tax=Elizabethkingia anophelis TaxID=1117645 RepID=UPI0020114138|nr:terminase large subunit [Elizabethkingia anophelis]MCL1690851.1 hypothetical protein [Elizabethkingia anophelis]